LVHLGSVSKGHELTWKFSQILPMGFGPQSLGKGFARDSK